MIYSRSPVGSSVGLRAPQVLRKSQHPSVGRAEPSTTPPIVHDALRSPGQPLDAQTRAFMEPRFGHDFGKVRVHTGDKATESAREVNAQAYTVGQDIVFGAGRYEPGTGAGRSLIAHELAHVVQQGPSVPAPIQVGMPGTPAEDRTSVV